MLNQFCDCFAKRTGKGNFAYINIENNLSHILSEVQDTLPVFPVNFNLLDDSDLPLWVGLREIMCHVPYGILFFQVPNLIVLSPSERSKRLKTAQAQLDQIGLHVDQIGWHFSTSGESGLIILLANLTQTKWKSVPEDFHVVSIFFVYNEEDIIVPSIRKLNEEGIEVYLIDNQSTDKTYELASSLLGNGLIGIEKWPEQNKEETFAIVELLKRTEEVALEINADWTIYHAADEIKKSPWLNLKLREAIWLVDQLGYNAIEFTNLNFYPIDNAYIPGSSFEDYFEYFEFDQNPGAFKQIRVWKRQPERVNLHDSAGHIVQFPGRKVFPLKFLMCHYPYRSQSHAERKIFRERKPRFNPEEKKIGWHVHYDQYHQGTNFLKDKDDLIKFDDEFYTNYMIERLTGFGIKPNLSNERTSTEPRKAKLRNLDGKPDRLNPNERNLYKKLESAKTTINNLEKLVNEKEQQILFYSQSKSWRITRPLRAIMNFLRNLQK